MNTAEIVRLLKNSGIRVLGADSLSVYIEDPSCVMRGFETFLEYAWVIIVFITGVLLFGWAISMIRGAKNDILINIRNLFLMFATLAMIGPILNVIYGDDIFGIGCKTINISINELETLLDARHKKMSGHIGDLYEDFQIYDSATTTPSLHYFGDDTGFVEPIKDDLNDAGKMEPIFYRLDN